MQEIFVAPLTSIPPGEGRNFEIAGVQVAIFRNRADELFAVQAACPHKGGPLADGIIGGSTLVCPLHNWKFEMRTGAALMGDCSLKTFPVRLEEGGRIFLSLET